MNEVILDNSIDQFGTNRSFTKIIYTLTVVILSCSFFSNVHAQKLNKDGFDVKAEYEGINIATKSSKYQHTNQKGAQWCPDAGFGLLLHCGISSVKAINILWSMIPGRKLANIKGDKKDQERIFREKDFNLDGKVPYPTPNQYFEFNKDFNPNNYDAGKWIKAAKDAGFTYAILTTKHHEGFAVWAGKYGNFNTKNFLGSCDLVNPFVAACKKYGLKVGLYYPPPDWYVGGNYKTFKDFQTVSSHPKFPALDANLQKVDKSL